MTLPDFEAWAVFAHIADTGSFTAAADATGLSKATVSKAIARLERSLGVALLHRTSRRLSLTEAGAGLAADARSIVEAGIRAEKDAGRSRMGMAGLIRMSAPAGYGSHVLTPLLSDFLAKHPNLAIDLRLHDRRPDFTGDRLDLAITASTHVSETDRLDQRPLRSVRLVLVASPEHLAAYGKPMHPTELASRPCLVDPRHGAIWHFHNGETSCDTIPVPVLRVDDDASLLSAARLGVGFARILEDLVADDIARGTLVPVIGGWSCPPIKLSLSSASKRLRPSRVTALMDHLEKGVGRDTDHSAGT